LEFEVGTLNSQPSTLNRFFPVDSPSVVTQPEPGSRKRIRRENRKNLTMDIFHPFLQRLVVLSGTYVIFVSFTCSVKGRRGNRGKTGLRVEC